MKAYPKELRERVAAAARQGLHSLAEVAEIFGVGLTFVKKMLKLNRAGESLAPRHGGGAAPTLTEDHLAMLNAAVETRPDATLDELRDFMTDECAVTVSCATLCRALQKLDLPRKKKHLVAAERDPKARRAHVNLAAKLDVNKFVFIDEMGSNRGLTRLFGRAAPGERVVDEVPSKRGENVSTIGAISLSGVRTALSLPGAIDGETMAFFVAEMLVPELRPGEIVWMDNCSIHKIDEIADAIEAVGAFALFIPPYSPDLNPIELFWSKVKAILRSLKARTLEALLDALEIAFAAVTREDILNWFAHCGYRVAHT